MNALNTTNNSLKSSPASRSLNTHQLAAYILNNDTINAQMVIGLPDLDHDAALIEVIRSPATIFGDGLEIIKKMLNGYLVNDIAAIIQACVLHGHTAILGLIIAKYTVINRDWYYYALSQLVENVYVVKRAPVVAKWLVTYAAEHDIVIQTNDMMDLLYAGDKATTYAVLDAIYDNADHYKRLITHLVAASNCQLSPSVVLYMYDNGKRRYTATEYAATTLRALVGGLVCKN
ncbi:hypothetical protein F-M6_0445 [Faustovirus]|nr:hypothetical protein F-M6_0445 [Faustovirus]